VHNLKMPLASSAQWNQMRKVELEVFSDTVNGAVIRHPMRRFPGVLIQGDTLMTMLESVHSLR